MRKQLAIKIFEMLPLLLILAFVITHKLTNEAASDLLNTFVI